MSKDSKVLQFHKYKFDENEEWISYFNSVEISPANTEALVLKLKAKWYKRKVDPDFEVEWISGTRPVPPPRAGAGGGASSAGSRTGGAGPSGGAFSGSYAASAGGLAAGALSGTPSQQKFLLVLYSLLVVLGLAALPVSPFAGIAGSLFMRVAALTFGYKVYTLAGLPTFRPWSNVMAYFQRVISLPEAHFLLTALTFTQQPLIFAILPLWLRALYQVTALASANLGHLSLWKTLGTKLQKMLTDKHAAAALGSALSELVLGLLLALMLLTPRRNLLTLFFWWQMLKIRFHMPETSPYHKQAWRLVDRYTLPVRQRVSLVQKLVGYGQTWFNNLPEARS